MEPNFQSAICPTCHLPTLPSYYCDERVVNEQSSFNPSEVARKGHTFYFCPNCGTKLNSKPLSTTIKTQTWIYTFSVILPFICFIFVTRWPGIRYFKSSDPKARQIGQIAWALLILSTILVIWLVVVWTQNYINSTVASINSDFNF